MIHGTPPGSTGLAAVQVAKIVGAKVIATGRSDAKLAVVKANGADPHPQLQEHGRDDGRPCISRRREGAHVRARRRCRLRRRRRRHPPSKSLRCVRPRRAVPRRRLGSDAVRGAEARRARRAERERAANQSGDDEGDRRALLPCTVIATLNDPSIRAPRLAQVMKWAASGEIAPHVSHVFPIAEFKEAMRAKWNGEIAGGCVLHP